ncbi:MAG: hypothetical protein JNN00_14430 [Chitinophagaceae bacterium]|nr:hypothetical protein [Chitinophagaceae bacterium]
MDNKEFYIGWMPAAPGGLAKHIRKVVVILIMLVITAGIILALQQKKFSTATFEFGQLTEITGIYQQFPVPSIKAMSNLDASGHSSSLTIPLVGYGKSGAEGIIAELEKEKNTTLDKKTVTFRGTLLYSDGKTLLQIDKNDDPLTKISDAVVNVPPAIKELGTVRLTGEILDPKCYFGVMKPGQGKPHRDCAIRCIAGGMSPVFYVRNEKGEANYYLILDAAGKKMNEQLKDIIAEPVSLRARAVQYDDWIVLYIDGMNKITRTGGLSWFKTKDGDTYCGVSHTINVSE